METWFVGYVASGRRPRRGRTTLLVGFVQGASKCVAFWHPKPISVEDRDLDWAESLMEKLVRSGGERLAGSRGEGRRGDFGAGPDRESGGLGLFLPRHREVIFERFGLTEESKGWAGGEGDR